MNVAILGATPKADKYANMAQVKLLAHGHSVVGVNPAQPDLGGVPVSKSVRELPAGIDTLTVYVGAERSTALAEEILSYGFRRVVFNPGAENPALAARLRERGVETVEGCTLVMLSTRQF
ncbi:MAG TPA: CoA-binding protein [Fibrobacteria bacterium]|nr:CoA-binding protein [Fibrobacteria bacterium]HOX51364.1 CoA-binding protein [Fibrobacteria bacterium]